MGVAELVAVDGAEAEVRALAFVRDLELDAAGGASSRGALTVADGVPKQSRSIATRNAESVLPDPVGARSNVDAPDAIAGQPFVCATVGASNDASNQARVARFAKARAEVMGSRGWHEGVTSTSMAEETEAVTSDESDGTTTASTSARRSRPVRSRSAHCGGRSTLSITWITPFEQTTSACVTVASLMRTPFEVSIASVPPWTVVASVRPATSAARTSPLTTW